MVTASRCKGGRGEVCAWASLQKEEWAAEYYRRQRKEGKSHTMALRALANQWVRIIHALWIKGEAYDRKVFQRARKEHTARRVTGVITVGPEVYGGKVLWSAR